MWGGEGGRKLFAGICDSVYASRMFVYPHPQRKYILAGERGQDEEERFPEFSTSGSVRALADWGEMNFLQYVHIVNIAAFKDSVVGKSIMQIDNRWIDAHRITI